MILCIAWAAFAQEKKPLVFEDFMDLKRLESCALSPDGKWIAYNARTYSLESNTFVSNIFVASMDGKINRQVTTDKKNMSPVWAPDGKSIAFVSNRDGSFQIYTITPEGGEPKKVTNLSTEISYGNGIVWSSDGKLIAFTSDVYSDCPSDSCNKAENDARDASKVKAQIVERLPFRVWDSWKDDKRSQLFVVEVSSGKIRDLIQGDFDVPPIDLGGHLDFVFSPDSKNMAFTMNTEPNIAWSTNNDVFLISLSEPDRYKTISVSLGNDNQPVYSPDGKYIAFNSMARAGFEADQTELMIYEIASGKITNLTEKFDRSVDAVYWSTDSKSLFFDAEDVGYHSMYQMTLKGGEPKKLNDKTYDNLIGVNAKSLFFKRQSFNGPPELFTMDISGKNLLQLTHLNDAKLKTLELNTAEEFWFEGANKTKVHGFIIKPPQFDANKKYPMVYIVHGGPQGANSSMWHWRWNAQLFASPGFVAVLVNPRGSVGYGQQFCDEISKDWGGKVYEDLMKGVDYVVENYKFIDSNRVGAAGGSYGGYMMNWINGHTDRFKCLVSHSGTFNKYSMALGTEELWFESWENGGLYWENKEYYEKWSPNNFIQNMKTPTLVIHGEKDYRVPVIEGIQTFQALQRKGVPSKFIYFPDEGHWILKPQNSQLWYHEVHAWLKKWLIEQAK